MLAAVVIAQTGLGVGTNAGTDDRVNWSFQRHVIGHHVGQKGLLSIPSIDANLAHASSSAEDPW